MAAPGRPSQLLKKAHRKVKTGCKTCRQRRVKCDEGFPQCQRCISTRRVCDGYGIWGGGTASETNQRAITQQPKKAVVPLHETLSNVSRRTPLILPASSISAEEHSYLEWFINGTNPKEPRVIDSPFWDPVILHASVHLPMVMQALLALSSAHKRKALDPANRSREGLPPDEQEIFFLKHYNTAIRGVHKHLSEKGESEKMHLLVGLIMCGIFTLLEYTRGNYDAGQMHLVSGSQVAKQYLVLVPNCETKFIHFLARLQVQEQATPAQEEAPQVEELSENDSEQPETPLQSDTIQRVHAPLMGIVEVSPELRFESTIEASYHLDAIAERLSNSAEEARTIPLSATGSRQMLEDEFAYHMAGYHAWDSAYQTTTADMWPSMGREEETTWRELKTRHTELLRLTEWYIEDRLRIDGTAKQREAKCKARLLKRIGAQGDIGLQKQILFHGSKWIE